MSVVVDKFSMINALKQFCYVNNHPASRFMRASILPENDIAWNLNIVVSRRRVEPGFRDDEYIIIMVNNRLLDQVELFTRSH